MLVATTLLLSVVATGPHPASASAVKAAYPAVPVTACRTDFGADEAPAPQIATRLPFAGSTSVAARVAFYSNGFVTLLGPRGWSCHGVEAADGGRSLSVFPPGGRDPLLVDHPGGTGVTALLDYTGHGPGALLVCSLFPDTAAAALARGISACSAPPPREEVDRPTPDVVVFRDPAGVRGTGLPSGGSNAASGVVSFPQLAPEPASVPIAKATCSLPAASSGLCSAIIGDFVTRSVPAATARG
jgi:hypothetical protein